MAHNTSFRCCNCISSCNCPIRKLLAFAGLNKNYYQLVWLFLNQSLVVILLSELLSHDNIRFYGIYRGMLEQLHEL